MREIDENSMEATLAAQIPEAPGDAGTSQGETVSQPAQESMIGKKLEHFDRMAASGGNGDNMEKAQEFATTHNLSRIGDNIRVNAEVRDGWMPVDRRLLGERAKFYPADWEFRIRPAETEAVRNWSTIDDENPNSVDDVFNEIIKNCLRIVTPLGAVPCTNIRSWDRFFFILLIREYTFAKGEAKVEYQEDCISCDNPVTFTLSSQALTYDMPDPEVMQYFDDEHQYWIIDPNEFDVPSDEPIILYLPTLEKDANIKAWMIDRIQNKKKVDEVFIKFLTWMTPSISKDLKTAQNQIRNAEMKYKSWDTPMFTLMNDIVKNIIITPDTKLTVTCPICGEVNSSDIRFPNGVSALFAMENKFKKFGKK